MIKFKEKDDKWEWDGTQIESVKAFTYLEYNFRRYNSEEYHIKKITTKATIAIKQISYVGKKVNADFMTRIMLSMERKYIDLRCRKMSKLNLRST